MNCMFSDQKEFLFKAPLGLEDPFWLIFGTLFGYPLGQKSRRGTPEAQGLEHKVQGPEHMSQICSRPCAPAPLDGSLGRLLGALPVGEFPGSENIQLPKWYQKGARNNLREFS